MKTLIEKKYSIFYNLQFFRGAIGIKIKVKRIVGGKIIIFNVKGKIMQI